MNLNLDLKKILDFNKKVSYKKDYFQINPDKYWNLLLIIFFLIIVLGAVFGFYNFFKLNKALNSYTNTNKPIENTNLDLKQKNEVDDLINYFKNKEEKSKSILYISEESAVDPKP